MPPRDVDRLRQASCTENRFDTWIGRIFKISEPDEVVVARVRMRHVRGYQLAS
jgi:hypothetical protein